MNSRLVYGVLGGLLATLLAGCDGATTTAPTAAPPLPSVEPAVGSVSYEASITGDAEPLNQPSGLALDPQGNLYVADTLIACRSFDRSESMGRTP